MPVNKRKKPSASNKTTKSASCRYCGQNIPEAAIKCHHCGSSLTVLGFFERFSNATIFLNTLAAVFAGLFAWISFQERQATETIKQEVEEIRSSTNFTYAMGQYQQMEQGAAEWRRCKALAQPDCDVLSLNYIVLSANALNAYKSRKSSMNENDRSKLQQLMCVGLTINDRDGEKRGLYAAMKDHEEATIVESIKEFIKDCPKYKMDPIQVHKLAN